MNPSLAFSGLFITHQKSWNYSLIMHSTTHGLYNVHYSVHVHYYAAHLPEFQPAKWSNPTKTSIGFTASRSIKTEVKHQPNGPLGSKAEFACYIYLYLVYCRVIHFFIHCSACTLSKVKWLTWRVKSCGLFKFTDFSVLLRFRTVAMAIILSISCKNKRWKRQHFRIKLHDFRKTLKVKTGVLSRPAYVNQQFH